MRNNAHLHEIYPDLLTDDAEADVAALIGGLDTLYNAPEPKPAFVALVRRQIEGRTVAAVDRTSSPVTRPSRRFRLTRRWQPLIGLTTAAVLILAVIASSYWWVSRPQSVSAREILQKAQAAIANPTTTSITSFHITETTEFPPSVVNAQAMRSSGSRSDSFFPVALTQEIWYSAPNRIRFEGVTRDAKNMTRALINVSDGVDGWTWEPADPMHVTVYSAGTDEKGWDPSAVFGGPTNDLTQFFDQAGKSGCRSVLLRGETIVAHRPVYRIDIGEDTCVPTPDAAHPSTSADQMFGNYDGRQTVWIDRETFFPLKYEQYPADGTQGLSYTFTNVEYNITIPDSTFVYAPPPGAVIKDRR